MFGRQPRRDQVIPNDSTNYHARLQQLQANKQTCYLAVFACMGINIENQDSRASPDRHWKKAHTKSTLETMASPHFS